MTRTHSLIHTYKSLKIPNASTHTHYPHTRRYTLAPYSHSVLMFLTESKIIEELFRKITAHPYTKSRN